MDIVTHRQTKNHKKELAIFMARQGFALLPLRPADKVPYMELLPTNAFGQASWMLLALRSASEAEIKTWFEYDPECNYGIITGPASIGGLFVLDIDDPGKIPPGTHIPPTVAVKTGRGTHYYYRCSQEINTKTFPFGELKGSSGYVVGPGSLHPSGTVYEFYDTLGPADIAIEGLPEWCVKDSCRASGGAVLLNTSETETGKRHRNNSVTMPDSFEQLEKLNQEPEIALRIMELCGRKVDKLKKAFTCPLPGHGERKPSAALYQEPGRPIVLNDFHEKEEGRRMWPLVDVFASVKIGKTQRLPKGERAVWWLRALDELGYINRPKLFKNGLPKDAKPEAKIVYDGFCYLLELRQLYQESAITPFNRNFAARWCLTDVNTIKRGVTYLLRHKYLVITEHGRPNTAEGGPALTMFKIGRP